MFALAYFLLLACYPHATADRVEELVAIAEDIATAGAPAGDAPAATGTALGAPATEEEVRLLVGIAVHESRAPLHAVGDGGLSKGPWQVRGPRHDATAALERVRWSYRICGDLSAFAGCGRCGSCPEIVKSLGDPTLPRR